MVQLLDDSDEEVVRLVEQQILSLGIDVIPLLEEQWGKDFSIIHQEKLEDIIHKIQFDGLLDQLESWMLSEQQDLFDGVFILCRYRYPSLKKSELSDVIDKIKLDAWMEMNDELTALEKVRILNHVFYEVHGFKGNTTNYHDPRNSYVNAVLEQKQGNPISLAIIYSIVAQRLGVPVFGVNLPQHFILAYLFDPELDEASQEERNNLLKSGDISQVMFYINPFNNGLVFTRQNIDEFIRQLKLQGMDDFYLPCNNVEILKRVIRNLVSSYLREKDLEKVEELSKMMEVLGGKIDLQFGDAGTDSNDPEA